VRAHGDRLEVDADSPESLDEVFWRTFDRESYLRPDGLLPHQPDDEIIKKFRAYVAAILVSGAPPTGRYLSKNNNNILRLPAIRQAFPKAVIIIPFRTPTDHAGSLMRQHGRFVASQGENSFELSYMTWLAHHEFGRGHRPFLFNGQPLPADGIGPDHFDYWLRTWRDAYAYLERTAPEGAVFVQYEALCANPLVWGSLAELAGVPTQEGTTSYESFEASHRGTRFDTLDSALLPECESLYERLSAKSEKIV
jgi:hypothetical protein